MKQLFFNILLTFEFENEQKEEKPNTWYDKVQFIVSKLVKH